MFSVLRDLIRYNAEFGIGEEEADVGRAFHERWTGEDRPAEGQAGDQGDAGGELADAFHV